MTAPNQASPDLWIAHALNKDGSCACGDPYCRFFPAPAPPSSAPLPGWTPPDDEHEGHYVWEVEPFDQEGPLAIAISMSDVECGQVLDVILHVPIDGDSGAEIEWARSIADDIAGRLNEHQHERASNAQLLLLLGEVVDDARLVNGDGYHLLSEDTYEEVRAALGAVPEGGHS